MTFADMRARLRQLYIREASTTGHYTDDLLDESCKLAAKDVGAFLMLPRYLRQESLTVSNSEVAFSDPAYTPNFVFSVSVENRPLRRVDSEELNSYKALVQYTPIPSVAVFHFIEASQTLRVAPLSGGSYNFSYSYYRQHDPDSGLSPWDGRHENYHHLILTKAAEYAFNSAQELELGMVYGKRYEQLLQTLPRDLQPLETGDA